MKSFDIVVIGSGCGMNVVEEALSHGLNVALIDKGPLGGTCPNLGCIPSKMLISPADRVLEIREAKKLGIEAEVKGIDFDSIMTRVRKFVLENQAEMKHGISHARELVYYEGTGHFIGDYRLEVDGQELKGDRIVIASGSRPLIPPIKGLDNVGYLTSDTVLQLEKLPESMIIVGGGYIAVEYGHFFEAMGTKVTILEKMGRLVLSEEPEVAELLRKSLSRRMSIHTELQVEEVRKDGNSVVVTATDLNSNEKKEFRAQSILVAVGRRSNADWLNLEKAGVETDNRGFIKVNEFLETNKKNIWAVGDINGLQMFTHVANQEALVAGDSAIHGTRSAKMDYNAVPHAVYSHPQIASVGLTEENAKKMGKVLVGRATYLDVAQGDAMMEEEGFAKAIVEEKTGKILGFHVVGPYAPIVIQEVINAMASGGHTKQIMTGMHIHPALPELIVRTLSSLGKS